MRDATLKCTELTPWADSCFGACENGAARPLQHVCYGSCPSTARLCDTMNGVICLDNDIECVEYGVDLTTYALDWATAIMTGDVVGIFNQVLGDHPDFDFPECTNW